MTFTFASGFVVGAFMVGALASLLLPTGVFISLAIWLSRSARRFREPVSRPPVAAPAGTPAQMSAQSATAPPTAQAPPPAQATPAAQAPPAQAAPAPAPPVQAPPAQAPPAQSWGAQNPPAEAPPDTPEPGVQ